MHSAELVKVAAAKRREKESEQQAYSSSSGFNSMDELRIMFAGKRMRQPPYVSATQQQQHNKDEKEEVELLSDYMRISRAPTEATKETESKVEDITLKYTADENAHAQENDENTEEIYHPATQIDDETEGYNEDIISEERDKLQESYLLAALSISLESDLPDEFYEKLFRQSQIRDLMTSSDSFRSGVEMLCKMHTN